MKKIITVSLVAMMAVSAARAEIASVEYTTGLTGNLESLATTEKSNLTAAINEVAGDADANAVAINTINNGDVMKSGITSDKVAAYDEYATTKQDALGYTAENEANKADAITDGMDKQASYPTVALMEASISTANTELGLEIAAANKAAADAQTDATQALADAAAASTAATNALTGAKAYTDELANGAVKTNTEAISAINNADTGILAQAKEYANTKAGEASGAAGEVADDLAEYIQSNDAAVEDKADKATTLAGYGITDAMTSTAIGQAIATATTDMATTTDVATAKSEAIAEAKTAGDAAYDAKGAAATAKSEAIAAAAEAADAAYQVKSSALSVGAENGAWTDLTKAAGYSTSGTHSLVLKDGTISWEKVTY